MANKRPGDVRSTLAAAASEPTKQPEANTTNETAEAPDPTVRKKKDPGVVKTTLILSRDDVHDFDLLARQVWTAGNGAKRIPRSVLIRALLTFALNDETVPRDLAEIIERQDEEK